MPKVSGWGRTIFSESRILHLPLSPNQDQGGNGRGAIPRGLGRSYGDSAQNSGGIVIDCRDLKKLSIDPSTGIASVGSGVTIAELELESLRFGYFPFVVPGTGQITIGGAIASDIHGKSHHRFGSFCDHVLELTMILANGDRRTTGPKDKKDSLFEATVGGLGLTGMVIEAKIQLMEVKSSLLNVNEVRVHNIEEMFKVLSEFDLQFHYTVAWLDLSSDCKGRGIVSGANFAEAAYSSISGRKTRFRTRKSRRFSFHFISKLGLINPLTVRLFNIIWFRKPLGKKEQYIQDYLHPLDRISNWNELFGKYGIVQYQFVIPYCNQHLIQTIIQVFATNHLSSPLSVLKSFGSQSQGLLGFPIQGWTLAIDFPANAKGLEKVLNEVDEMVCLAGGRVYLTKDSRISTDMVEKMYPNLDRWREAKRNFDPENYWKSDQSRRLNLC